jgi:hypothetical protein
MVEDGMGGIATGCRIRRNGHPIACSPQNNAVIKRAAVGREEEISNAECGMEPAEPRDMA